MADTKKPSTKKLSYRGENLLQDAGVTLSEDKLKKAETKVDKVIADKNLSLARHQVDALVSFYDNVGASGLRKVVTAIESDRVDEVPALMAEAATGKNGAPEERVKAEVDLWEGGNAQVLSPKLRMIANGDDEVNAYRALLASSVSSTEQKATQDLGRALVDEADTDAADGSAPDATANQAAAAAPLKLPSTSLTKNTSAVAMGIGTKVSALPPAAKKPSGKKVAPATVDPAPSEADPPEEEGRGLRPATKATVSCFVHLEPGAAGGAGAAASTPDGSIEVHELDITDLEKIRHGRANEVNINGRIAYVETGSPIAPPKPRIGASVERPPKSRSTTRKKKTKKDASPGSTDGRPKVIVGVIDVGGFDFAHEDFLTDEHGRTTSRFLALWDQGLVDASDHAEEEIHPWNRELHLPALGPADDLEELSGLGEATKAKLATVGVRSKADLAILCDADLTDVATKTSLSVDDLQDWADEINRDAASVEVPFGALFGHQDFDQGIRDAKATGLEPTDFVTQTIEQPGAHATHVASIAAGNSGVCPEAWIVGVTIAMGDEDVERRASFYDSTRLGQAIDFITRIAKAADLPVAINISLGTNGHAHDGTSPINKWIESTLREQGRVVCVAAGNSGKETAAYDGDIGFMSGRIHSSGRISAKDLIVELGWQVVGNGIVDVSENEMEIWYNPGDEFAVQIRSPSGEETEWVKPGAFLENWRTESKTFLSVYSERFIRANGANRISLFLSPKYKGQIEGVEPGVWRVRLRGERIRDGRYNAWIERDDMRPVGRIGESDAWTCPSYFTLDSNVDTNSLNSLGCSNTVIAVANVEGRGDKINMTSSQGPTRDGRPKPDIAAPGTDIVAARGFARGSEPWVTMTGTSMASPYVAGVAANMLIQKPTLTAGQVLGIIHSTAKPLPGTDYAWRDDAGFGVIEEQACLDELERVFRQVDAKPMTDSDRG